MGRGISFDYARALDRATRQFWRTGYAATSLRDLLKAIGIGEGSFYNTMGSKKQLYRECLAHYGATEGRKRAEALLSGSTLGDGLRAMFRVMLDCLDDPETPSRLCMLAGLMSEDVLADADLRRIAEDGLETIRTELVSRLMMDKKAGAIRSDIDLELTASVIITYAQGLWRMAMVKFDRPGFENQVEYFISGLRL